MSPRTPQVPPERLTDRQVKLRHIENITTRCGPEVVAAVNRSLAFFEDLNLAQGELKELCYIPPFEQTFWGYIARTGDPDNLAALERLARSNAKAKAMLVRSDEDYAASSAESIRLQKLSMALQQEVGHAKVPRHPPPPLTNRKTFAYIDNLVRTAIDGVINAATIRFESIPGSLKKLQSYRAILPAGPVLEVWVILEFDSRNIWSEAVFLVFPGKQPYPVFGLDCGISPASDFAWPAEMPLQTRIACYVRAMALFARQIARQSDDLPS